MAVCSVATGAGAASDADAADVLKTIRASAIFFFFSWKMLSLLPVASASLRDVLFVVHF